MTISRSLISVFTISLACLSTGVAHADAANVFKQRIQNLRIAAPEPEAPPPPPPAKDPHFANVVLLAQASGAALADNSQYHAPLTFGTGATLDSVNTRFPGTASMAFTASSTGIWVGNFSQARYDFATTNTRWTVEAWVRLSGPQSSIGTYRLDVVGAAESMRGWEAGIYGSGVTTVYPGYGGVTAPAAMNVGQWHHVTWQRNGLAHSIGVDGVVKQVQNFGSTASGTYLRIGGNFNNLVGIPYNLQDVRMTSGVNRYPFVIGATYDVPTEPLPAQ